MGPDQEADVQLSGEIIGALIALYLIVVYALRTRRGGAISRHPYRDPYGDAPGAWRNEL
jgi:hypothetical protein